MHLDLMLTVTGAFVGLLVGLTGTGGGALLTPCLVLVFGVPPLAAVSSDLLTSLVMKPVATVVHLRRRTVHLALVGWLSAGSMPAAFAGAALAGHLGHSAATARLVTLAIGAALLASVAATFARALLDRRRPAPVETLPAVRPLRTVAIGVVGGFAVGLTSVGAGSLIIAMLALAYPRLRAAQLVGTDLAQSIPLVAAATAGHLLFGAVHLAVTASLLVGALPAIYLGARLSAAGPARILRPVVVGVLVASALALLHRGPVTLVAAGVAASLLLAALSASRAGAGPRPQRRRRADRRAEAAAA